MKKIQMIFLALGMLLCLIPFAGMAFRPTTETTENRTLSSFPSVTKEKGGLNTQFFEQFETWFQEHFAFRNELVAADNMIQGKVFGVSTVRNVVYGTDDWLYYTASLGDYLGTNHMSPRELYNLEHNLAIVKEWADQEGIPILFTVPANKNTLYGEHMPYYDSLIVDPAHTIDSLPEICQRIELPYADLLSLFREQEECLYLKRDSHWNNKGALMAYRRIMEETGFPYETYEDIPVSRAVDTDGDQNRMLYTFYGEKEMNYSYELPQSWSYVTDTKSVEDGWIETEAPGKKGTLVMFRDSFGNTLLPFVAGQFEKAVFSKESPYRLQKVAEEQDPDLMIIEKVERNLKDFIISPPILESPSCEAPEKLVSGNEIPAEKCILSLTKCVYDPTFFSLTGEIPEELLREDTDILLQINGQTVKAYHKGLNGFEVFLDHDRYSGETLKISVIVKDGEEGKIVCNTEMVAG